MFILASVLYLIAFTSTDSEPRLSFAEVFNAALNIALASIIVFVWRPMMLHKNRVLAFILMTLLTILAFGVIDETADLYIHPPGSDRHSFDLGGFGWSLVNGWTAVAAILAVVLFTDGLEERRRAAQLEKFEKTAQLTALQQQLNPHILLNGLNNIYSLASQNSPHTAPAILELTDILRYALYETGEPSVTLSREVQLLQNYIGMQKLGLENRVLVDFEVDGPIEHCDVAPLILLPIVENAFKHGTNMDRLEPAHLIFRLKVTENSIRFESSNPYSEPSEDRSYRGVGLENVRSRLELAYQDRCSLTTRLEGATYKVIITLDGSPA